MDSLRQPLSKVDPKVFELLHKETERQEFGLEMIPSENYVSEAVLEANGSIATNKYSEGLPGKRYYGGNEVIDQIEALACERLEKLFGAEFSNVQPHSGAQANQAVYEALLNPGDTVMGMRLDQGGHLTHGSPVNFSGKHYKIVAYGVRASDGLIDEQEVMSLASEHRPKMIIAGASAYSRRFDFAMFKRAADSVGAILMADIAHYAGLVAAGEYPTPIPYCDVVTTTTHKTLRGPRSGVIMARKAHAKALNKAVFPGLQGGPHEHIIAAKAVSFLEASKPEFKQYARNVIANAKALAAELVSLGFTVVSGGTDSHMLMIDLRPQKLLGREAEETLDKVGITVNKNVIPWDTQPPLNPSGIRIGTPALSTRGMGVSEMKSVAGFIKRVIEDRGDPKKLASIRTDIKSLCQKFPMYRHRLVGGE